MSSLARERERERERERGEGDAGMADALGLALLRWFWAFGARGAGNSWLGCQDRLSVGQVLGYLTNNIYVGVERHGGKETCNDDPTLGARAVAAGRSERHLGRWPSIQEIAQCLQSELGLLVSGPAGESLAGAPQKRRQKVMREPFSRFLHLAVGVWVTASGVRSCVLLDSQFPACTSFDGKLLQLAVNATIKMLSSTGTFSLSAENHPQAISLEDGTAVLLVHRPTLLARLSAAVWGHDDPALYVDVSPCRSDSGILLRGRQNLTARKVIRAALKRLLEALTKHCRIMVPIPLDIALSGNSVVGSNPGELVSIIGWLLGYSVVYVFGHDLAGPSAGGNCLSGKSLTLASIEFNLELTQAAALSEITVMSFSVPEPIFFECKIARCLTKELLRKIHAALEQNVPSDATSVDPCIKSVIIDRIVL